MPRFRYIARSMDGRKMEGTVIAGDPEEVSRFLQEIGVYAVSVAPVSEPRRGLLYRRLDSIPEQDLLNFLVSLSIFLDAGIPLQSALMQLRMKTRVRALAGAIEQMQAAIDQGSTMTEALRQSRILPLAWLPIIEGGERSGDFSKPLRVLHRHSSEFRKFKKELISHMIMPVVLVLAMAVLCWVLFNMVIPALATMVDSAGGRTVFSAEIKGVIHRVIAGLRAALPLVLVFVLFAILWIQRSVRDMGLSRVWIPTATPVLGPLIAQIQLVMIASSLQSRLGAGVTLVDALQSMTESVKNPELRRDLQRFYRRLWEGVPVQEAVFEVRLFPPSAQALLVAGMASGKTPEMLGFLVKDTQALLMEEIERLAISIQTAVVVSIGTMVGFIVFLFFTLLWSVYNDLAVSLQGRR